MHEIKLIAEGQEWTGFQSLSIRKSMGQAAHSFSLTTTDRDNEGIGRWNVRGGSEVRIEIDGVTAFEGFVQKYKPNIGPEAHSITIEGASRAIDLVQASHDGKVFWKNTTPEAIIAEVLKPFGISATIDSPMKAIGRTGFKVGVGEKPFAIIRKLADKNGMTVYTDATGQVVVSRTPADSQFSSILRGEYLNLSVDHDLSQSFSEVIVKGQQNTTAKDFKGKQRGEKRYKNEAQTRHRPHIIVVSGDDSDQEDIAQYANRRFSGNVLSATATVKSAFTKAKGGQRGPLWAINRLVALREPVVDVDQQLLITDVEFSLSEGVGFETRLTMRLAKTHAYEAPEREPRFTPQLIGQRMAERRAPGPFGELARALRQGVQGLQAPRV